MSSPQLSCATTLPMLHGMYGRSTVPHRICAGIRRERCSQLLHARQAARLLGELRALMRQRGGEALLGCRLRLSARLYACLVHLRKCARSVRRGTSHWTGLPSLRLSPSYACPMPPRWHGVCSRLNHYLTHTHSANRARAVGALLQFRTASMSSTCSSSSARSCASAAAMRCSAAASASPRASARAWCT